MKKKELKVLADKVLEQFPNANIVYATVDGNVFLEENRANLHAKGGLVIPFERDIVDEQESLDKLNVSDTVKLVLQAKTLEELSVFESDERTGVIKAVEKQKKKLKEESAEETGSTEDKTVTEGEGSAETDAEDKTTKVE